MFMGEYTCETVHVISSRDDLVEECRCHCRGHGDAQPMVIRKGCVMGRMRGRSADDCNITVKGAEMLH